MPLPALLLERLKKRKIIQEDGQLENVSSQTSHRSSIKTQEPNIAESKYLDSHLHQSNLAHVEDQEEEIIAEDYSDDEHEEEEIIAEDYSEDKHEEDEREEDELDDSLSNSNEQNISQDALVEAGDENSLVAAGDEENDKAKVNNDAPEENLQEKVSESILQGNESVLGCPNKYNIFHDCSQYCIDNYGQLDSQQPTLMQRKQLALILKTYPLPNDWSVVYDPGVRTFYFWNITTDLVSWLPPAMNGFVSFSADHIRKTMKQMEQMQKPTN